MPVVSLPYHIASLLSSSALYHLPASSHNRPGC